MFSAQNFSFMYMLFLLVESMIISVTIFIIPLIFYKKEKMIQQIESGFQTLNKVSLKSFSINFFFILIIFIIFDLELILIFSLGEKMNFLLNFMIIIFIIFTLWMEWILNKIKWINYFMFYTYFSFF